MSDEICSKMGFLCQYNLENLDRSNITDLEFWDIFWKGTTCSIQSSHASKSGKFEKLGKSKGIFREFRTLSGILPWND